MSELQCYTVDALEKLFFGTKFIIKWYIYTIFFFYVYFSFSMIRHSNPLVYNVYFVCLNNTSREHFLERKIKVIY